MSLRERMKAVANRVRSIPARPSFDERPTSVTIRSRTWNGGRRGAEGGYVDVDLVLVPRPKVREVRFAEITASAGRYVAGDVKVGPITPRFVGGGYTEAQLSPSADTGTEVIYVLGGHVSGEYTRVDLSTDRSHAWFLTLRKRR